MCLYLEWKLLVWKWHLWKCINAYADNQTVFTICLLRQCLKKVCELADFGSSSASQSSGSWKLLHWRVPCSLFPSGAVWSSSLSFIKQLRVKSTNCWRTKNYKLKAQIYKYVSKIRRYTPDPCFVLFFFLNQSIKSIWGIFSHQEGI